MPLTYEPFVTCFHTFTGDGQPVEYRFTNPQPFPLCADTADFSDYTDRVLLQQHFGVSSNQKGQ